MAKDPAILFYTSDFLTGTMFMSDEQVGKYMRLLCAQHQKGRLTHEDMIKICSTYDKHIFDKFTVDKDGMYYNQRLESEIIKRKKYSESRSKNRSGKKTYDEHMENENENRDNTGNTGKGGVGEKQEQKDTRTFNPTALNDPKDCANYFWQQTIQRESAIKILKNNKLRFDEENLLKVMQCFVDELKAKGEKHTFQNFSSYFVNWLRINGEKYSLKNKLPNEIKLNRD